MPEEVAAPLPANDHDRRVAETQGRVIPDNLSLHAATHDVLKAHTDQLDTHAQGIAGLVERLVALEAAVERLLGLSKRPEPSGNG